MRERRVVFGEAADAYDRVRPGYPAQLVDDLLAAAGPGPVLEVGAGTGKATAGFAARDIDLTCVEPDARMAAVLRRNIPGVRVVDSTFEDWQPDRGYGLLYSAQAWHWIDPSRRADLAWRALAPGGRFAPFWNVLFVLDRALHTALAAVDARHGLTEPTGHAFFADDRPPTGTFAEEWASLGLDDERFTDMRSLSYSATMSSPSALYRDHLLTTSQYRLLDPAAADAALTETAAVIDTHGGVIDFEIRTEVALATRRPGAHSSPPPG